ncbi:egg cell-secreted protein 1.4-like [Dendrobium catenatum]|uniref:Prolamin-like domain-containing protein n=2 Tax=Dendrobium TaxID=37818 RepID=A0A8T3C5B1_DENNO|nr:egg cell-secreted protein 1.4-like [Dendrobium catenatum]KAI0529066.1 hypothetical protein KFK09_001611 [Dendrobium nobile]KAI0529071.1 hypothetical protein KFK09_001616 [Dendrobium nobile]PKU71979.1 Egg cell-secreted protein 1.4 [Dendrobium catenatum]
MANHSSAAFAILLLLAAAMATPQKASSLPLDVSSVLRCWEALSYFDGCFPKVVVPAALNVQLKLTIECCRALEEIRENCFPSIYSPIFSFAPKLGSVFLQICGDQSAPAPQPATID